MFCVELVLPAVPKAHDLMKTHGFVVLQFCFCYFDTFLGFGFTAAFLFREKFSLFAFGVCLLVHIM